MILNHHRTPVWAWDGLAESKCPMCGELLVARRCRDKVWHWAHKPHTNQKAGTCLFDDSPWALKWRLGYLMFPGWEIERPRVAAGRTHLLHALNPATRNVREFVGHINDANVPRFQFLLGAQNHQVMWMFNGKEWCRNGARQVGNNGGYKDFLKPKAQALYEQIILAGQNALIHLEGPDGSRLYREWVKPAINDTVKVEHTGVWFPCEGEKALAVLDNYSRVTLPYDNAKSEAPKPSKLDKLMEAV